MSGVEIIADRYLEQLTAGDPLVVHLRVLEGTKVR